MSGPIGCNRNQFSPLNSVMIFHLTTRSLKFKTTPLNFEFTDISIVLETSLCSRVWLPMTVNPVEALVLDPTFKLLELLDCGGDILDRWQRNTGPASII